MSTAGISSNTTSSLYNVTNDQNNPFSKIKKDFQSLSQALQSGNLDTAKSAYQQLQQDQKAADANRPSNAPANSSLEQAFQSLGSALNSNDLSAAQSAFSTIQQDFKAHGHGHHHGNGVAPATTSVDTDGDNDNSGSSDVGSGLNVSA